MNSGGWRKATQREVCGLGSRLGLTDVKQEGLREILAGVVRGARAKSGDRCGR